MDASNQPPAAATEAVLVVSEEMPEDAQKVQELDFDDIAGEITAEDLCRGMRFMGFQASSLTDAIRIINDMVGPPYILIISVYRPNNLAENMERSRDG